MTYSMTAFASASANGETAVATWELRSVNHRYLDLSFRLPDSQRALEPLLRKRLQHALRRGKVDCSLRLQRTADDSLAIDPLRLTRLIEAAAQIAARLPASAPLDPLAILGWPGMINLPDGDTDADAEQRLILGAFDAALADLLATRAREGAALADILRGNLETVTAITATLRQQLPMLLAGQRERLQEKLQTLLAASDGTVDAGRFEQEMVLLAQKSDVAEELDRLDTHVDEVRRTLEQTEAGGRRLDFLMQELNREANTLASKSLTADTTRAAVDLKVLIEQMREQVQNVE